MDLREPGLLRVPDQITVVEIHHRVAVGRLDSGVAASTFAATAAELARQLGVSRQPVREALHRLEAEGWVDLRPGQGAFVHVPTEHEVDRLLDVRSLLEAEAARLAAKNASATAVTQLRTALREGAEALAHDDPQRVVAANAALHAQVTALSENDVLAELAGNVEWRMRWYHRPVALARGQESWREHEVLIDAIGAGDAAKAAEVMRHHVEMTRQAYHRRPVQSPGGA